jgi:hypothetical protein
MVACPRQPSKELKNYLCAENMYREQRPEKIQAERKEDKQVHRSEREEGKHRNKHTDK